MKLLVWDTSSKVGALAALEWQSEDIHPALVSEWTLNIEVTHSERLLWAVHEMLEAARWRLEDVDLFGVGVGPGSFTGLRVGLTTARTLAHQLGKPLVGVSSLAALARPVAQSLVLLGEKNTLVIASTDACKGELFALWGKAVAVVGCATGGQFPLWKTGVKEQVIEPENLMRELKKKLINKSLRWIAVGEGRSRYPEVWAQLPRSREMMPSVFEHGVQGRYVGLLAWEAWRAGLATNPLEIHPRYLRAPDAERKLKKAMQCESA